MTEMNGRRILYISYNGIGEPLVRSQVLNYLEALSGKGYKISLLTFEKNPPSDTSTIRESLAQYGLGWDWLPSHRGLGPLSTAIDVRAGMQKAIQLCRSSKIEMIHARSFVPAVIARAIKSRLRIPFIYDIRGFWVDEKVYKGSLAQNGVVYRLAKELEGWVYAGSDVIVSLTDRGLEEIRRFSCFRGRELPPFETIPTCVDIDAFTWKKRNFRGPLVFGYIGSLGPGYLPEAVFRYFALVRQHLPGSRLHLITRTNADWLWEMAAKHCIPREEVVLRAVAPDQVPVELDNIDVGLSFIQPHFAKLASCPTKVGEYLAAGIPVISNSGIGDLDRLIGQGAVGYVVSNFTDKDFVQSLTVIEGYKTDSEIGRRCRLRAEEFFSLAKGVSKYDKVYRSLLDGGPGGRRWNG